MQNHSSTGVVCVSNAATQAPFDASKSSEKTSPAFLDRFKTKPRALIAGTVTAACGLILALALGTAVAQVQPTQESTGARSKTLLAAHAELTDRLTNNVYGRPLFIESTESKTTVSGDAYAILDSSFRAVNSAFKNPGQWCEVMILHINTKYCRASTQLTPSILNVNIGKKTPQELSDTFALQFGMKLASTSADYLSIQLNSDQGPVGTSNYRIEFEATPLGVGKTFMHLRYSYGYGVAGRLAMQGYLATLGSGKVGFTSSDPGKNSAFVGGMRGAVERNTMRYYLAIEAYLASQNKPEPQQLDSRFEHWFDATERYQLQLHEVEKSAYLMMKKAEHQRQQQVAVAPGKG